MSDNEMIAQFMGMEKNKNNEWEGGWFLPKYVRCKAKGMRPNDFVKQFSVQDLAFDRSWDWLMSVIEEIWHSDIEDNDISNISESLCDAQIDGVYEAVVEFIKNQKS